MKKTINELRIERKLKQKELAKLANIPVNKISLYETGKKQVPNYARKAIAKAFGLEVSQIEFDIDEQSIHRATYANKTSIHDEKPKKETKVIKLEPLVKTEAKDIIESYIYEIGCEYADSAFKTITLLKSDREKFLRLADFKKAIENFNLDTQNHIKREKEREKNIVGKVPVEVD